MPLPTLEEFEQTQSTTNGAFRRPVERCVPRRGRYFSRPNRDRSDPFPEEYANLTVLDGFKPIYTGYNCRCCVTGKPIREHDVIFWAFRFPKGRSTLSVEGYAMHTGQSERLRNFLRRR